MYMFLRIYIYSNMSQNGKPVASLVIAVIADNDDPQPLYICMYVVRSNVLQKMMISVKCFKLIANVCIEHAYLHTYILT